MQQPRPEVQLRLGPDHNPLLRNGIMANDEHTLPASAGKTDEVLRLISESLSTTDEIATGLRRLQSLPDKTKLKRQTHLLRGMATHVSDAESYLSMILELVAD